MQTAELGAPGFHHDRWSALHPFFVGGPAWAELGPDLSRHGLEYVTAPLATASSLPDGRAAVAPVDPEAFADELERLGETAGWNALFMAAGPHLQALLGLLGDGLDGPQAEATLAGLLRNGRDGALPFGQLLAGSAVDLVRRHFNSEELRSLAAPWPLHIGAGPEAPASALWAVLALAALAAGVRLWWEAAAASPMRSSASSPSAVAMCSAISTSLRSSCRRDAPPACARPMGSP